MKRKRLTTRLTPEEVRLFKIVARYARQMCGPVSDAEVLRYLIRNWTERWANTPG